MAISNFAEVEDRPCNLTPCPSTNLKATDQKRGSTSEFRLMHGPPGNDKSTAIRAIMTSRGLSAFTIRLYQPQTSDAELEDLFEEALSQRPAMIIFEDLDRAFPKNGTSQCQVSLQAMLNALDGVASGEGMVVVATANEAANLDPAILRRPGRFDRVVLFPNLNRVLREQYYLKMKLNLDCHALHQAVSNSKGFSFAQLREAVVLSAQFADERNAEVGGVDLLRGIEVLRKTMVRSSAQSNRAGFVTDLDEEGEAAEKVGPDLGSRCTAWVDRFVEGEALTALLTSRGMRLGHPLGLIEIPSEADGTINDPTGTSKSSGGLSTGRSLRMQCLQCLRHKRILPTPTRWRVSPVPT